MGEGNLAWDISVSALRSSPPQRTEERTGEKWHCPPSTLPYQLGAEMQKPALFEMNTLGWGDGSVSEAGAEFGSSAPMKVLDEPGSPAVNPALRMGREGIPRAGGLAILVKSARLRLE